MFLKLCNSLLVSVFLLIGNAGAQQEKLGEISDSDFSDSDLEFFENQVRPLLIEKCYECHGPDASPIEGGLSLVSRSSILAGGDTGPGVVVGNAEKSLLIDAINYGEYYEMPPDTKMTAEEIAVVTKWVEIGAPWPSESDVQVDSAEAFDIEKRKSGHWCWQPIKDPALPAVKNEMWIRDSIDNYVLAKLENAGLEPAKPATKRTLIRRVYFDLIGLPPTPDQIQKYLDDDSETAFETVVDELLASPAYGERWARHWMDLTRFAETYGHEFDFPIHHAYRYRDYLIRAFNSDVPYDQFIHEHIAGDLLRKPRRHPDEQYNESVIGTGFWFLGEAKHGAVDVRGEEARAIDNQIDVMSKTFLGLTVACARCHDHKFDAISTEDYYSLAGFLQSSRRQLVMLDPNRKIENAHEEVSSLSQKGNAVVTELVKRISDPDEKAVAKYIDATIEVLRRNDVWNLGKPKRIEAEKLTELSITGGTSEVQELTPRDGLVWGGNEQRWWKNPQVGDKWSLEFEVEKAQVDCDYRIVGDFTKASDYGIFKVSVDGTELTSDVNFFSRNLTKTGPLEIGRIKLNPGKHSIEFESIGQHKKAQPNRMLGIDWLELRPVATKNTEQVEDFAAKHELDPNRLAKFVVAIKNLPVGKFSGSLQRLRDVTKRELPIDQKLVKQIVQQTAVQNKKLEKWDTDTKLFADFSEGLPEGWFKTGYAYELGNAQTNLFSPVGSVVRRAGTMHSGVAGGKFFGVICSPTFELTHPHIHTRLRGKNVRIRLIIDGFEMDIHSSLLFKGAKIDVQETNQFKWQLQAGDIKNYLGHRAHLEFIDHGDGWVEIDEIRFSVDAKPPLWASPRESFIKKLDEPETKLHQQLFAESISRDFAKRLKKTVPDPGHETEFDHELASWIIENNLVDIFESLESANASTTDVSLKKSNGSTGINFVSTNANGAGTEITRSSNELIKDLDEIGDSIQQINQQTPDPQLAVAMTDGTAENEHIFIRGNHKTLGEIAPRHFLSAISARKIDPQIGSGRLELARKITAPNNPVTSRVAVNRIWHHLLGVGIVESVDNFGVLGKTPTHPQLLDRLATDFVKENWSIKKMIRRIVLTQTYQMSSEINPAAKTIDPNNQLLHRARIKRLQGEAIRDAILQTSGQLDRTMFGASVPVHLTKFMEGRGRPQKSGPLDGNRRRSIYTSVNRNFLPPMMLAFDTPIPFNAIGKRNQSNVPAQALILMNDPFVIDQSQQWAQRLVEQSDDVEARIAQIYVEAFGRPPADWELEKALGFIEHQSKQLDIETDQIATNVMLWKDFCHVIFNVKEFIFIP